MNGRLAASVAWGCAAALAVIDTHTAVARHGVFPDLDVYRVAVGAVGHGGDALYRVHGANGGGFTYPPFAALVLAPLRALPLTAAGVVLALVTLAACAATARLCATGASGWVAGAGVACALETVPFRTTISFGQIGALLMALVAVDLLARRSWLPRGVIVGVAAAVKLTPAVFVVFLAVVGRRREARTAVLAFAAASALAAIVMPVASWRYWTDIAWRTSRVGDVTGGRNRSLWGLLLHNGTPRPVVVVVCVAVALAGLWWARSAWAASPALATATVGFVGCLVSPITWTHHLVWVLPAMVGVLATSAPVVLRAAAVATITVVFARLSPDAHLLAVLETAATVTLVAALPLAARDDATRQRSAASL